MLDWREAMVVSVVASCEALVVVFVDVRSALFLALGR